MEVHVTVEDGGTFDLSETEKEIKIAVVLGKYTDIESRRLPGIRRHSIVSEKEKLL